VPVFEQVFTVQAPIEKTWEFLLDVERLAPCIPGCEKVEPIDDTSFFMSVAARVGIVHARFRLRVTMTEKRPPHHLSSVATGEDSALGSSVTMQNSLDLRALGPAETEVRYRSEVSVLGRLGAIGFSVMKEKVKRQGEEFAANVRRHLA
jgi:carbon monoxide dehydrogenase subunit G